MQQTAVEPQITPGARWTGLLDALLRFQSFFGLIAIFVASALLSPTRNGANVFLETRNLLNIVRFSAENGIIAIGMTLVILTGGIDLSVGAVLALCAVGAASCLMTYGYGTALTILVVLAIGSFVGFLNGFISTRFRIQSFITTLAMMSAARGVASLWDHGYAIPLAFGQGEGLAPPSFKSIFGGEVTLLGIRIPNQIFFFAATWLLAAILLQRTGIGRHIYAVGANENASRLSGVNVDRVRILVFVITGFLVGVAAMLHAALVNQGSHIDGAGYELNAIAAVVIGGTSLMGGSGGVTGTVAGALILQILDNILPGALACRDRRLGLLLAGGGGRGRLRRQRRR